MTSSQLAAGSTLPPCVHCFVARAQRFRHCRHFAPQPPMPLEHHAAPQFFGILKPPGEGASQSQPRNVVGEGLGWVTHGHTELLGITDQPCLRFSGCALPMFRTPCGAQPAKSDTASPEKVRAGAKKLG